MGKRKSPKSTKPALTRTPGTRSSSSNVKLFKKGNQRKSGTHDALGEIEHGSPTVVINKEMTAGKKRLLNESPIRDILANENRQTPAAQAVVAEEKSGGGKLNTSDGVASKVRKSRVTVQKSTPSKVISVNETFEEKFSGSPTGDKSRSKSVSRKLSVRSERQSSTVVEKGCGGGEVVPDTEHGEKMKSVKSSKSRSATKTSSIIASTPSRGSEKKKIGRKSISGKSVVKAVEVDEKANEETVRAATDVDKGAVDSEIHSFVDTVLNPAEEIDVVVPGALASENDANPPKESTVDKRRKPVNRTSKRVLLRKQKEDLQADSENVGPTDTNNKGSVSKTIKKKRGDAKKAKKKTMKDVNSVNKLKEARKKANDVEAAGDQSASPGVMYIGHIPHGFYEKQIAAFFSQFGRVLRVRVSRSWRTGKSSGFGFVMFADKDVAVIAAEAMDGYLMHGRRLKTNFVPAEKVHEDTFKPKTTRERLVPISEIERRNQIRRARIPFKLAARSKGVKKEISRKKQRLQRLGVQYSIPNITVLQQESAAPSSTSDSFE